MKVLSGVLALTAAAVCSAMPGYGGYDEPELPVKPVVKPVPTTPGVGYSVHFLDRSSDFPDKVKIDLAVNSIPKFTTIKPALTGTTNEFCFAARGEDSKVALYGKEIKSSVWVLINHQFYIKADKAGPYTISFPGIEDNYAGLWVGDNAIKGFTTGNTVAVGVSWADTDNPDTAYCKNSYVKLLNAGDVLPVRIVYINGGGGAEFQAFITGPGTDLQGYRRRQLIGVGTTKTECLYSSLPGAPPFPELAK